MLSYVVLCYSGFLSNNINLSEATALKPNSICIRYFASKWNYLGCSQILVRWYALVYHNISAKLVGSFQIPHYVKWLLPDNVKRKYLDTIPYGWPWYQVYFDIRIIYRSMFVDSMMKWRRRFTQMKSYCKPTYPPLVCLTFFRYQTDFTYNFNRKSMIYIILLLFWFVLKFIILLSQKLWYIMKLILWCSTKLIFWIYVIDTILLMLSILYNPSGCIIKIPLGSI